MKLYIIRAFDKSGAELCIIVHADLTKSFREYLGEYNSMLNLEKDKLDDYELVQVIKLCNEHVPLGVIAWAYV